MIQARMIIEIMGRPPEHVTKAIEMLIEKLSQEKGITIKDKIIHEPVEVKEAKNLYSTFAEIEVTFDSIATYLGIMFAYLPSNIEIIQPQELRLKNEELTSLGNTVIARIHAYDALAKRLIGERDMLANQLNQIRGGAKKPMQTPAEKAPEKKKTGKKSKKKA